MRGDHEVGEEPTKPGPQGGHVDALKYEAMGQNAPIALAIGMDPMLTYVTGQGVPSHEIEHSPSHVPRHEASHSARFADASHDPAHCPSQRP
jgi:hypothetical protein